MPHTYKDKATDLVLLVEKRTQEARGWKQVAEGRLIALKEMSTSIEELENILVSTSLGRISSIPQENVYDAITDASSVRDGLSSLPDLVAFAKAFIGDVARTVAATEETLASVAGHPDEDLSIPPEAYEGIHDFSSLSLEDLGAYDHPPPLDVVTPPPSSPSAVVTAPVLSGEETTNDGSAKQSKSKKETAEKKDKDKGKEKHKEKHSSPPRTRK